MKKSPHSFQEPYIEIRSRLIQSITPSLCEHYDEILEAAIKERLIDPGYVKQITRLN